MSTANSDVAPTDDATNSKSWQIEIRVDKWHDEASFAAGAAPDEVTHVPSNMLMNAGIQRMLDLLLGAGGQALNATHCRIGVGNSATAEAATQTDLQAAAGSTNRWFQLVSSGPTRTAQSISCTSTFASADGNFVWAEWGLDLGTASGNTVTAPLFNRKVAALGTKASGAVWQPTVTITIA